jgi:predicted DNA-binding transcriptional regulator YafY
MSNKNARIQWMHNRIAAGNYPNEYLLAEKFGISKRQAERDVRFIREELKAPIVYDAKHKGLYYNEEFSLPVTVTTDNDDDYAGITAKFTAAGRAASDETVVQLQIPYTAELEIKDKLAALELKNFVTSSKPRKNLYVCAFHSVELFLGIVMSLNADIKIISPKWLRDRAVSSAEKILRSNKEEEQ